MGERVCVCAVLAGAYGVFGAQGLLVMNSRLLYSGFSYLGTGCGCKNNLDLHSQLVCHGFSKCARSHFLSGRWC